MESARGPVVCATLTTPSAVRPRQDAKRRENGHSPCPQGPLSGRRPVAIGNRRGALCSAVAVEIIGHVAKSDHDRHRIIRRTMSKRDKHAAVRRGRVIVGAHLRSPQCSSLTGSLCQFRGNARRPPTAVSPVGASPGLGRVPRSAAHTPVSLWGAGASGAAALAVDLHRRAGLVAVGVKHAAVAGLGFSTAPQAGQS